VIERRYLQAIIARVVLLHFLFRRPNICLVLGCSQGQRRQTGLHNLNRFINLTLLRLGTAFETFRSQTLDNLTDFTYRRAVMHKSRKGTLNSVLISPHNALNIVQYFHGYLGLIDILPRLLSHYILLANFDRLFIQGLELLTQQLPILLVLESLIRPNSIGTAEKRVADLVDNILADAIDRVRYFGLYKREVAENGLLQQTALGFNTLLDVILLDDGSYILLGKENSRPEVVVVTLKTHRTTRRLPPRTGISSAEQSYPVAMFALAHYTFILSISLITS
jgi:hypothetical protein